MPRKIGLFRELKRRNVFRVAIAYLISSWLLAQVADLVLRNMSAPPWAMKALLIALALGFPITLVISWVFEVTPEGVIHESQIDRTVSITDQSGKRLDRIIVAILAIVIIFMGLERLVFSGHGGWLREIMRPEAPSRARSNARTESEQGDARTVSVSPFSVAVLPFAVMSTGPDDDYYATGLTEEIINALSQLPELMVTARTSAFHFKGHRLAADKIARQLGVANIVEGSVHRAGEQLHITAQLVRAKDGFQLWSKTYDGSTGETFAIRQDIAEKVATALNILPDEDQRRRMQQAGIRNVEAFIAYQKGMELFEKAHQESPDILFLRRANEAFEEVVAHVPGFDDAYVRHSELYSHVLLSHASGKLDGNITESDIETAPAALRFDQDHAVEFARDQTERLMAQVDRNLLLGDWRGLAMLNERALKAPGCKVAYWAHLASAPFGHAREIHDAFTRMAGCDPFQIRARMHLAWSLLWLGQPLPAQRIAEKTLRSRDHYSLVWADALALSMQGNVEAAQQVVDTSPLAQDRQFFAHSVPASMRGDVTAANDYQDEFLGLHGPDDQSSLVMEAVKGNRSEANRLAAMIDRRPFGYMVLLNAIYACICGAPFDLEATPVFEDLLVDSGLPWPPGQTITLPLKNW